MQAQIRSLWRRPHHTTHKQRTSTHLPSKMTMNTHMLFHRLQRSITHPIIRHNIKHTNHKPPISKEITTIKTFRARRGGCMKVWGCKEKKKKVACVSHLDDELQSTIYIYIINKPTCYIISLENNFFMIKSSH